MDERVSVRIDNGVATVTMNRPDKFNAVDQGMIDGLVDAGLKLRGEEDVRAIVLAGEGKNFCAGIDLELFSGDSAPFTAGQMGPQDGSDGNYFQRPALIWREIDVPVIAAVHGICFGAGLQIALGADIRVVSPSASLSVMEVKWGIVPDMGMTVTARGLVARDQLKALSLTGRVFSGDEARELGLATAVADDPLGVATAMASEIAAKSPDASAAIKRLLDDAMELPEADALKREAAEQLALLGQPNQQEAVRANLEKRGPEFAPRQRRG